MAKRLKRSTQLVECGPNLWHFDPSNIDPKSDDLYDRAQDAFDCGDYSKAIKLLKQVVQKCPMHIDAYNLFALISHDQGDLPGAISALRHGLDLTLETLPTDFFDDKTRLEWGFMENRPFLRAYCNLAMFLAQFKCYYESLVIFKRILKLNPNDNQGVRALLVTNCLEVQDYDTALEVCNTYSDDMLIEILYGRPLILFLQNKLDLSEKSLKEAIEMSPLVAKELTKKTHKPPKDLEEGYITVGSPGEAYEYYLNQGTFWEKAPGAIDFIKRIHKELLVIS